MKRIGRVLAGLAAVVSLSFACQRTQAQSAGGETQALMKAIEATTPSPASEAPKTGEFYSTQHGDSWPPLPGDMLHLPFWDLGGGMYLLDDTNVDYAELAAEAEAAGSFRRFGAGFNRW